MHSMLANIILDFFYQRPPVIWPILAASLAALVRSLWWGRLRRRSNPKVLDQPFDAISADQFQQAIKLTNGGDDEANAIFGERNFIRRQKSTTDFSGSSTSL
jgi:hypothetical protein